MASITTRTSASNAFGAPMTLPTMRKKDVISGMADSRFDRRCRSLSVTRPKFEATSSFSSQVTPKDKDRVKEHTLIRSKTGTVGEVARKRVTFTKDTLRDYERGIGAEKPLPTRKTGIDAWITVMRNGPPSSPLALPRL